MREKVTLSIWRERNLGMGQWILEEERRSDKSVRDIYLDIFRKRWDRESGTDLASSENSDPVQYLTQYNGIHICCDSSQCEQYFKLSLYSNQTVELF